MENRRRAEKDPSQSEKRTRGRRGRRGDGMEESEEGGRSRWCKNDIPLDARRAANKLDQPDIIREDENKNEDEENKDERNEDRKERRETKRQDKRKEQKKRWDGMILRSAQKEPSTKHNFLSGGGPDSFTVRYNTMAEYGWSRQFGRHRRTRKPSVTVMDYCIIPAWRMGGSAPVDKREPITARSLADNFPAPQRSHSSRVPTLVSYCTNKLLCL